LRILTTLGRSVDDPDDLLDRAITNAFNFLDNMDGLSAAWRRWRRRRFLSRPRQWAVVCRGTLAALLGALLGFLCFNFPPPAFSWATAGAW
jgi:hypothetical protein